MKAFRYALPGGVAAIVVGIAVGFLAFTHAPPAGTAFDVYLRLGVGFVAGSIGAGVVWFATVLIIQAKMSTGFDDEDDPFDDPFFDR